jgi:DNA invertase Pin-like site-specific DNA recombinase
MAVAMAASMTKPVRCAIYTRKSTEHGLELEFNSLDAQRDACEAYIKSQASQGWEALPVARQSGWEHSDNQDGHFGGRGEKMIVAARR